jgi:molecular chaperone GrpE
MSDQESSENIPEGEPEGAADQGESKESESAMETERGNGGDVSDEDGSQGCVSRDEVGADPESEPEPASEDPLEKAREEHKKLREQMLRLAADFDNFRKRARRENEEAARRSKIEVLRELLPVFDNMERAVAHAEQATDARAVATGVQMVVKQFVDTIGKLGVERVKSVGELFDPSVHEAIQQIETSEHGSGTVMAELLPGYQWGDRLLRAAMVVVAKAPPEPVDEGIVITEPEVEEPVAEEASSEEPAAEEAAAQEPAAEEPTAQEPAAEEPAAQEPAAEEPAAQEPAAEEPAAQEPAAEEPAAQEPAAEEPAEPKP